MKKLLLTSALMVLSLSEVFAGPTYYVKWVSTRDVNKGIMDWCHSDQAGNCLSKGNFGRLQLPVDVGPNKFDLTFKSEQPQKTITFEYKGNGSTTLCKGTYTFQENTAPNSSGTIWDVKVSGINEKDKCNVVITPMS
jgi:hypothetical protein